MHFWHIFFTESKLGVSLIYSHEKEEIKPDENIVERIDSVMKNLVQSSRVGDLATKQSSAHDFTKLVELVRKLDKKRMTAVWDKYFDCVKSGACKENEFDVKSICRLVSNVSFKSAIRFRSLGSKTLH